MTWAATRDRSWWPRRSPVWGALTALLAVGLGVAGVLYALRSDSGDDVIGPGDGQAGQVQSLLEPSMTCTSGRLTERRSLLACYRQTSDAAQIAFVQADPDGEVASYTVETIELSGPAGHSHTGELDPHNLEVADEIAAVVTPGTSFAGCSHDYTTPFFCFEGLAFWQSATLAPVTRTGTSSDVPAQSDIGAALAAELRWDCDYGWCSYDGGSMTVQTTTGSTGLQYAAPADLAAVRQSARVLIGLLPDASALRDWVEDFDGTLDVIIADGHVVGFLPQPGGGGLLVVGEVAGVLPAEA